MQPAAAPARRPLSAADIAAADAFLWLVRAQGVRVAIVGDHATVPNALEIYSPVTSPWHPTEVRWIAFRDALGVRADDVETGERHGPGTMSQVLADVGRIMDAERAEATSRIPVSLALDAVALRGH